jgi:hypothetical protein
MRAAARQARQHPRRALPIPEEAVPRDQLGAVDFSNQNNGLEADRPTVKHPLRS